MAWVELTAWRSQCSRTYEDTTAPGRRCWEGTLAALHYESALDSGVYDAEVDFTPQRIDNPQFDGWRITQGGWHYALGKDIANHGDQDGWVGFGGRQGAHWFKFRLLRVGYLHWPTREWQDIGGAPSYDRANLTQETATLTIGLNDEPVNVSSSATWESIWTTPGGGRLDVCWRVDGYRLKEEITINQAARGWIETNRPPATPLDETWFGFVFELDWSDIPRIVRRGVVTSADADFADDGERIELRDGLDRLVAFLPLSRVRVPGVAPAEAGLRKRFWSDGGPHYLLVGVRCDVLQSLPDGDLVFDPTVDKQVGAGGDDGHASSTGYFQNDWDDAWIGKDSGTLYHSFFRWTGVTLDGTIDTSYIELELYARYGSGILMKVVGVDEDSPAAPTSNAEFFADPLTTAAVDWDADFSEGWNQSPSLNSVFQELVDSYTISNDAVMVQVRDDGTEDGLNTVTQYDNSSSLAAKLHIEYSVGVSVSLDALAVAGSAQALSVVPGAVSLSLDVLTLAGSAEELSVLAAMVVLLDALALGGSAQALSVVPGAVALPLDGLTLAGSGVGVVVVVTRYPTAQPLMIKVGGTDQTQSIPVGSIWIKQIVGRAIDTAHFVVQDGGELGISEFDSVVISNPAEDTRYFAGFITHLEKELVTPLRVDLHCRCQDYTFLLERTLANKEYEAQTDAAIIGDLFSTYLSDIEASTYVENLLSGDQLSQVIFNRVSLRAALDALATMGGGDWYVDYGPGPDSQLAYLHYFHEEANPAPYSISDDPDLVDTFPCERLRVTRDLSDHLNLVTIVGGDYLSDDTDFILGCDGVQTEVLLPYEFESPDGESVPLVYKNTNTDESPTWSAQTVGIDYQDSLDSYDVLFNKRQKLLKFATAPSELKRSVKITGRYEVPLRQRGRNQGSYDVYGRWLEGLIVDPDLVRKQVARERVKGHLRDRDILDVISCRVREPGLVAGQRVELVNSVLGLDGVYIIQQVVTRFEPGGRALFDLEMS